MEKLKNVSLYTDWQTAIQKNRRKDTQTDAGRQTSSLDILAEKR